MLNSRPSQCRKLQCRKLQCRKSNYQLIIAIILTIGLNLIGSNSVSAQDDKVADLSFDDIQLEFEPGDEYDESLLTDEIKELDDTKIKIRGFMFPTPKQTGITSFILVRDNQECCYGPNAAIHDCILIRLKKGDSTDFTVRPVTVEGTFYIKEFRPRKDSNPLAVYRMKSCKVSQ